MTTTKAFESLQERSTQVLALGQWAHVPVILALGFMIDAPGLIWSVGLSMLLAGAGFALFRVQGNVPAVRYLIAAGYVLQAALFVFTFRAHPFQIDMHMYFFAALAMTSALLDWRAILVAAGVTAVHHLVLNFIMPFWVFPEGANLVRVVLHAVIVVAETLVVLRLAAQVENALHLAGEARLAAEAETQKGLLAAQEAQVARGEAEKALEAAKVAHQENETLEAQQREERDRLEREARERLEQVAKEFEDNIAGVIGGLKEATGVLAQNGEDFATTSRETQSSLGSASDATRLIDTNVSAVAASAEEMTGSVGEISRQVSDSRAIAEEALANVERSTETISTLAERAEAITGVVDIINGIAEQTNLLALNATIEAARAGEAGKGFAVVASEVKSLANQSASATQQIGDQLSEMQTITRDAVERVGAITDIIQRISANSVSISSAVEEQHAATQEIARAAQTASAETSSASGLVSDVLHVTSKLEQSAATTCSAVSGVENQIDRLHMQCSNFAKHLNQQGVT